MSAPENARAHPKTKTIAKVGMATREFYRLICQVLESARFGWNAAQQGRARDC